MALSLAACGGGGGTSTPPANSSTPPTSSGDNNSTSPPSSTPDDTSSGGNTDYSDAEWPDNEFTALIPKPEAGEFLDFSGSGQDARFWMSWTEDEMMAYVEQAKEAGFTQYPTEVGEGSDYRYTADSDKANITIMSDAINIRIK